MPKLNEVFGISTKPILSYIERRSVDGRFLEAVNSDHHIVVYGASKQGKTTLRQKHLKDTKCEIYSCNPNSSVERISQHILRQAGARIESTETFMDSTKYTGKVSLSLKVSIPWFTEGSFNSEGSGEQTKQKALTSDFVDVSLSDPQMVASILNALKFTKFIVLENFHYLTREVQKNLSYALKTFHELSIKFIILGVWRESNQLLVLNPDLQDRVTEIPVEPWRDEDFDAVMDAGQKHLNVIIPDRARDEFKKNSYGNVGMVQEFLRSYCTHNDVLESVNIQKILDSGDTIGDTITSKAADQRGRLLTALEGISAKSRTDRRDGGGEPLTMPYYLVQVLLTAPISELTDGITKKHLLEKIRILHRRKDKETIRINDVAHLLKRLPYLQDQNVSPFLYYDSNQQRLRIVDAGLMFALAKVNRESMKEDIFDPLESYDDNDPESDNPNAPKNCDYDNDFNDDILR
jgi:hypothetical protein